MFCSNNDKYTQSGISFMFKMKHVVLNRLSWRIRTHDGVQTPTLDFTVDHESTFSLILQNKLFKM